MNFKKPFAQMVSKLVKVFIDNDCSLAEINPLVVTKEGTLIALDAKMTFDDNALYRHEKLKSYFDANEEDPQDLEAAKWNLNYIRLDGNIGCMVNGAGLAMATMDIIKFSGGSPANFLDVGGGASGDMVREAFKILTGDKKRQMYLREHLRRNLTLRCFSAGHCRRCKSDFTQHSFGCSNGGN